MKVALARSHGRHAPDSIIDLPDAEAKRLIDDGKARIPTKRDVARSKESDHAEPTPPKSGRGRTSRKRSK